MSTVFRCVSYVRHFNLEYWHFFVVLSWGGEGACNLCLSYVHRDRKLPFWYLYASKYFGENIWCLIMLALEIINIHPPTQHLSPLITCSFIYLPHTAILQCLLIPCLLYTWSCTSGRWLSSWMRCHTIW